MLLSCCIGVQGCKEHSRSRGPERQSGGKEEEPRPNLRSTMTRLSPSWFDLTYNCMKEATSDMPQGKGN